MNRSEKVLAVAEQQCKQSGARLTNKRKLVLSALLHSTKALSAYEIADICREEEGQTIPVMSVYRMLEFLEQEHLVHKLQLANKYVACAHITCSHTHQIAQFLICQQCGEVKELGVDIALIDQLQHSIADVGYKLTSPQLELNCVCPECQKAA
ncbi:transcriptional repressor [Corallincola luteus]|uniref:Transcriptional repressor n=1 Tax=Corallincola luteus TaxID=1775177 RepID=A0ABY2APQ7_9GAMM|nr:Fur family transcriptional regulator [Corallincola luteus]TCI03511.1 transcriptional repressor [Corallincola luteus]